MPVRAPALFLAIACLWALFGGTALAGSGCPAQATAQVQSPLVLGSTDVGPAGSNLSTSATTEQHGPLRRLLAHSHVISWIRTAARRIIHPRSHLADPAEASAGNPSVVQPGCVDVPARADVAARPNPHPPVLQPKATATARLPRTRPDGSIARRFEFAFAASSQTPGALSIERELAGRLRRPVVASDRVAP